MKKARWSSSAVVWICLAVSAWTPSMSTDVLYVGTQAGDTGLGGRVYKYDGLSWTDLTPGGLGSAFAVMDLAYYDDRLFAGVQVGSVGFPPNQGQVWRFDELTGWAQVGALDESVTVLEVYDGALYAATPQSKLYRCNVCDGTDWVQLADTGTTGFWAAVVTDFCGEPELMLGEFNTDAFWHYNPVDGLRSLGDHGGSCIWDIAEYDGRLYAGAYAGSGPFYRTVTGADCDAPPIFEALLSTMQNNWALENFQGLLYMGSGGDPGLPPYDNGRLWTFDGDLTVVHTWPITVFAEGVTALAAQGDDLLYIGLGVPDGYYNGDGVAEVWVTDGTSYTRVSPADQFGGGVQSMLLAPELGSPPDCITDEDCDDGDPCTDDICDAGTCVNAVALGTMLAVDGGPGYLYSVDQTSGVATPIGNMGLSAPSLAVDPLTRVVYAGSGGFADQLFTVDPVTASVNPVGSTGLGLFGIVGLDFNAAGTLYASVNTGSPGTSGGDFLAILDKLTGTGAIVGPFGVSDIGGIAFGPAGALYGSSGGGVAPPTLYTINPATGTASPIGLIADEFGAPPSGGGVNSLEFDVDGVLYGGTRAGDLIRIDPATAIFSLVGGSGSLGALGGLAVRDDCPRPCSPPYPLYATDGGGGNLYTVDPVTGVHLPIGAMGISGAPSLALDPTSGVLYAGGGGGSDMLYTVDPITASANLVGITGLGAWGIAGLDFDAAGNLYASVNTIGPGQTGGGSLARIDELTGAGAFVGPFGVTDMGAIVFSPSGLLYGASGGGSGPPTLYAIDPGTGVATPVGPIVDSFGAPPPGGVNGLEFDLAGFLYGATSSTVLIRIDPATGIYGSVGSGGGPPIPTLGSLATSKNCRSNCTLPSTLYGTDGGNDNLYTVDQVTGLAGPVGNIGIGGAPSLAMDPATGLLYAGTGGTLDQLYTVDPVTATPTLVGTTGLGAWGIVALTFNSVGTLYASVNTGGPGSSGGDTLALIDKISGAGASVGPFGVPDISAMAFNAAGVLYGTSGGSAGPVTLYLINVLTGAATAVGPILDQFGTPVPTGVSGLDFDLNGILYGGSGPGSGDLIRIDTASATYSTVGNSGAPLLGALSFLDLCPLGECTSDADCDDGDPCTTDTCNLAVGTCSSIPVPATIYATDGGGDALYTVNQASGIATPVGLMGTGGAPSLAVDPATGVLYAGTGGGSPEIFTVDPVTATANFVAPVSGGIWSVAGMDFDAAGILYASTNTLGPGTTGGDRLATIDKATGVSTFIGPFGPIDIGGITFSPAGILFGSSGGGSGPPTLYTINIVTGAAAAVGPIVDGTGAPPAGGVSSLQFDLNGLLYGGTKDDEFILINPATGTFSLVGTSGAGTLGGLAVKDACARDCVTPLTLYGTDGGAGNLLTINQVTGVADFIGNMGTNGAPSLAVDPTNGVLYAGEGGGSDLLYTVDPITASANPVGPSGLGAWGIAGLDFDATGTLYASVITGGGGQAGGNLLATLDKLTGTATIVGAFDYPISAISFDATGVLYGSSGQAFVAPPLLHTIDVTTGQQTEVGRIDDVEGFPLATGVGSLEFGLDGYLYAGVHDGDLIRIDPTTAIFSTVGPTGFPVIGGLALRDGCRAACIPSTTLYSIDGGGASLFTIDPVTASSNLVGPTGVPAPSLVADPTTGWLYAGTGGQRDELYRIDPLTGIATFVGRTGLGAWGIVGLGFDAGGTLYASVNTLGSGSMGGDSLAVIDKLTGAGAIVGHFGFTDIAGIAFTTSGALYGTSGLADPPVLYAIDPANGAAGVVGPLQDVDGWPVSVGVPGLESDLAGFLYGATHTSALIHIDPATAVFSYIGNVDMPHMGGLAMFETCPVPCSGDTPCDDGDPCTIDLCDPPSGTCRNDRLPDSETAEGLDDECYTADDNPCLYGVDERCGTDDDGTGDGLCDAIDFSPYLFDPTNSESPDSDLDGISDACDCAPLDDQVWGLPTEARELRLSHSGGVGGTTTLNWTVPLGTGTTAIVYDTLRSTAPDDFVFSAICLETDDGPDTVATDSAPTSPGEVIYYLVRPGNDCGDGPLGWDSAGLPRPGRPCSAGPSLGQVFVTSQTYDGNLGGIAGGSVVCNQLAAAAGLPGFFLAWLSDTVDSPSTTFVQSPDPYRLVDGTVIANDWSDLTDGVLASPIDIDENGFTLPVDDVWTGTSDTGVSLSRHCSEWTTAAGGGPALPSRTGYRGGNDQTGSTWTNSGYNHCNGLRHLYCFEQ